MSAKLEFLCEADTEQESSLSATGTYAINGGADRPTVAADERKAGIPV